MQRRDHSKAEDARQVQSIQVQQAILTKEEREGGKVRQREGMCGCLCTDTRTDVHEVYF